MPLKTAYSVPAWSSKPIPTLTIRITAAISSERPWTATTPVMTTSSATSVSARMAITFHTRSSARRGSLAISRPTISCSPSPATIRNTVLNDIAKMKSPNCSSPSSRAMTTKKASEATLPTASPASRASVPDAIRRDAEAVPSGSIEGATLGDVPSGSKP